MHPRSIPGLLPRAALALAMLGHAAAQVTLKPAAQVPDNASPEISGSFASFATEAASFYNYSMGFSQNIFKDYQKRTGAPIIFRVGGTSM